MCPVSLLLRAWDKLEVGRGRAYEEKREWGKKDSWILAILVGEEGFVTSHDTSLLKRS